MKRPILALARRWAVACCTVLGTSSLCHAAPGELSEAQRSLAAAPFTLVAPFPAGGPVDTLARMLANGLSERYKQAAIVDNRTGANGNIGIEAVLSLIHI